MKNILLFDMDGTLIDSKKTIADHFIKALDELNISHTITSNIIGEHLEIPFNELNEIFEIGMNSEQFKDFIECYRTNYAKEPLQGTVIYPLVKETLDNLKEKGYRFILVTGKHIDNARLIMKQLKLENYFELIQGWEEELKPKPDPDILIKAIEKAGVNNNSCIMIGDTYVDILAGKALNIPTIAATYGLGKKKTLDESEPDFIIHQFVELINILEKIK